MNLDCHELRALPRFILFSSPNFGSEASLDQLMKLVKMKNVYMENNNNYLEKEYIVENPNRGSLKIRVTLNIWVGDNRTNLFSLAVTLTNDR
jgi:hypothetical protein